VLQPAPSRKSTDFASSPELATTLASFARITVGWLTTLPVTSSTKKIGDEVPF